MNDNSFFLTFLKDSVKYYAPKSDFPRDKILYAINKHDSSINHHIYHNIVVYSESLSIMNSLSHHHPRKFFNSSHDFIFQTIITFVWTLKNSMTTKMTSYRISVFLKNECKLNYLITFKSLKANKKEQNTVVITSLNAKEKKFLLAGFVSFLFELELKIIFSNCSLSEIWSIMLRLGGKFFLFRGREKKNQYATARESSKTAKLSKLTKATESIMGCWTPVR